MNKAIDDLLRPRYKVIADYPDNEFEVGEILPDDVVSNEEDEILKYPHLFKKLEWWEERQISEMPEYVKLPAWHDENETEFLHVDGKNSWHHFNEAGYFGIKHRSGGGLYVGYERSKFLPATEADFINYQKQQGHE